MVPEAGIEPARPLSRGILSPLCLPISPPGRNSRVDLHRQRVSRVRFLKARILAGQECFVAKSYGHS